MFKLKTTEKICASHVLSNHGGKCQNLHGHNYIIEVEIHSKQVGDDGMIVDFSELKSTLNELDHAHIVNSKTTDEREREIGEKAKELNYKIVELPFIVTAENLAKYFWDEIDRLDHFQKVIVTVWETDKHRVTYTE